MNFSQTSSIKIFLDLPCIAILLVIIQKQIVYIRMRFPFYDIDGLKGHNRNCDKIHDRA